MKSKRAQALELLLSGESVPGVASKAHCSERQIYRWLKEPDFTAPLREMDRATGLRLAALEGQALDCLVDVMSKPEQAGAGIKRMAAKDILEIRLKWLVSDFEERILEVERRLDEISNRQHQ